jgi:hypothetical protein
MNKVPIIIDETQAFGALNEDDRWGQPPASHYIFSIQDNVMFGYPSYNIITSSSYTSTNLTSRCVYLPTDIAEPMLDTTLSPWDALSDEELATLYAEAAEEDQLLAQLGLEHYAEVLRQEEESE